MRTQILTLLGAVTATMLLAAALRPAPAPPAGTADPRRANPDAALAALKSGNERFAAGHGDAPNRSLERVRDVAPGQAPFASILTCADSRLPPELIFDAGFGDLFVCRVAGSAGSAFDVASLEYGTEHLGTPLIVVMGHSRCGAVDACLQNAELHGSLPFLMSALRPAVDEATRRSPGADPAVILTAAIHQQVFNEMEDLIVGSNPINSLMRAGKAKLIGAYYEMSTGKVEWLGEHPQQKALLAHTTSTMH